jgi:hypothetical protein
VGTVQYYYSSVAIADTLGNSGGISSSATSIQAGSGAPVGYPQQYPFKLRLEPGTSSEEIVKIVSGSGTAASPWIVGNVAGGGASSLGRGWDGTTARSHNQGAALQHGLSAEDLTLSRTHESLDNTTGTQPHGLPVSAWTGSGFAIISEQTLSVAAATVTFSAIPASYAHLLLIAQAQSNDAASYHVDVGVNINGDSAAKYSNFNFGADNTSGSLGSWGNFHYSSSQTVLYNVFAVAGAKGLATSAGTGFVLFTNYSGTTFSKGAVSYSGYAEGTDGRGYMSLNYGTYNPATQAAISSLTFTPYTGSFTAGSFFGLYGLGA